MKERTEADSAEARNTNEEKGGKEKEESEEGHDVLSRNERDRKEKSSL